MARLRLASALREPGTRSRTASLGTLVPEDESPRRHRRVSSLRQSPMRAHWRAAARARFGRETFAASVHAALNRLTEAA